MSRLELGYMTDYRADYHSFEGDKSKGLFVQLFQQRRLRRKGVTNGLKVSYRKEILGLVL